MYHVLLLQKVLFKGAGGNRVGLFQPCSVIIVCECVWQVIMVITCDRKAAS